MTTIRHTVAQVTPALAYRRWGRTNYGACLGDAALTVTVGGETTMVNTLLQTAECTSQLPRFLFPTLQDSVP